MLWTVDAVTDTGTQDPNNVFAGDLRYCVTNAQNGDQIDFNIPGGGNLYQINLTGTLTVNTSVVINGMSQPGYNGQPLIEINGQVNNVAGTALDVTAAEVTVAGLSIVGFTSGAAIDLSNANGGCAIEFD